MTVQSCVGACVCIRLESEHLGRAVPPGSQSDSSRCQCVPLYLSRGRGGTSKAGRMQAFSHSSCHTTTHTEIPDCIYPFAHMHSCVMRHSPHAFLRYTCRLCEGLGATRRAAPYTLHTHYIIFADLRRTRRDTCAAPYTLYHICRPAKGLGVKRAASIH